jgi:preprotein translocase subunit SecA
VLGEVATRSAESFRAVAITAEGTDLEAAGLKRPTATWTYLVQDNPFGTDLDRAIRGLGRLLRKAPRTGS